MAGVAAWSDSTKKPQSSAIGISSAGALLRTDSGPAGHATLQKRQTPLAAPTPAPCKTVCLDDGDFCEEACTRPGSHKAAEHFAHFADGACSDIPHNPFSELVGPFAPDIYVSPATGLPNAASTASSEGGANPLQDTSATSCNPMFIVRTHATHTMCETFCANSTASNNYVNMLNAASTKAGKDASVNAGTCELNTNYTEFLLPAVFTMYGKPAAADSR